MKNRTISSLKTLHKRFPDCTFLGKNKIYLSAKLSACQIENSQIFDDVELNDLIIKNAIIKKNNISDLKNNIFTKKYFNFLKKYDNNFFDDIKILLSSDNQEVLEFSKTLFQHIHAEVICAQIAALDNCAKNFLKLRADIGFCFFENGKKLFAINHKGQILDGDEILYLLTWQMLGQNAKGKVVYGTQKTNLGIENKLRALGVGLVRLQNSQNFAVQCRKKNAILGAVQEGEFYLPGSEESAVFASRILASVFLENKNVWEKVKENKYVQIEKVIGPGFFNGRLPKDIIKTFVNFYGLKLKNQGRVLIWDENQSIKILVECTEKTTGIILATDIKRKLLRVLRSGAL